MLQPIDTIHSRNHSFENNTPCPPYNLSPEDVFPAQPAALQTSTREPTGESDDLLLHVESIYDPVVLKRMLIEKELERQDLVSNLDLAARLGLGLQQQLQQSEMNAYIKVQALQDQNLVLQSKANKAMELSSQLTGSEVEVRSLTGHNESLQRDLDGCRRELKSFRQELDSLVEQMTHMGGEVKDAKSKVTLYARRLGEVEQELTATQELNTNLQVQLEMALDRQKQSHSSTTQVVKMIQSDLGKVVHESGQIRSTVEELEHRQVKCEGKVVEMISNTREYAQWLEEAQDTIQTLRQESDTERGSWHESHGSYREDRPSLDRANSLGLELGQNANSTLQSPELLQTFPTMPVLSPVSAAPKHLTPAPSPPLAIITNPVDGLSMNQAMRVPSRPMTPRGAPSPTELFQRLEERNLLQNALASGLRPEWNPSVAVPKASILNSDSRSRSRSMRSSRSVSQSSFTSVTTRGKNALPSPQPSPSMSSRSNSSVFAVGSSSASSLSAAVRESRTVRNGAKTTPKSPASIPSTRTPRSPGSTASGKAPKSPGSNASIKATKYPASPASTSTKATKTPASPTSVKAKPTSRASGRAAL